MTRRILFALLLFLPAASTGFGQDWAKEMFDHTSHDFGTVARGAKVEHRFLLENIYEETAHISAVRSSCGCTIPQITKRTLKTWDKSEIVVALDTRSFLGRKDSTLTVVFDLPFPAEVQLHTHSYIRSDVVVQPGVVQFGSVAQGTSARRKVSINYAGRDDWRIKSVESANPHIHAQAVETSRALGQVTYDLLVTLEDDAPAGYIRDHLALVTNDLRKQASRVPVAVEGAVVRALRIRPSPLMLGVVETGQTVTKQLVVQGRELFRIVAVRCDDDRFKCSVPQTAKTLHLLPVTFTAGEASGKVSGKIRIETDRNPGNTLEVMSYVRVMPSESG